MLQIVVCLACTIILLQGCTRTYTLYRESYDASKAQGGDFVSVRLPGDRQTYVYRDAIIDTWEIPGDNEVLAAELEDFPATLESTGIGLTIGAGVMLLTGALVMGLGSNVDDKDSPSGVGITFLVLGFTSGLGGAAALLMAPYVEGPHPPGYDPLGPVKGIRVLGPQ